MNRLSDLKLWEKFEQTGKIDDYLSYKSVTRGATLPEFQNGLKEDAHFGEFKSANERTDTQRNEGQ
ncbi:MAG: hypothetical protein ACI396_02765 [Acutalibacteraceae bacterium]